MVVGKLVKENPRTLWCHHHSTSRADVHGKNLLGLNRDNLSLSQPDTVLSINVGTTFPRILSATYLEGTVPRQMQLGSLRTKLESFQFFFACSPTIVT